MNIKTWQRHLQSDILAGNACMAISEPGIGKSQVAVQMAYWYRDYIKASNPQARVGLAIFFMAVQTPIGVGGLPWKGARTFVDPRTGESTDITVTDPAVPQWYMCKCLDTGEILPAHFFDKVILIIEEWGQGAPETKRSCAELLLSGSASGWSLPAGSARIALTNADTRDGVTLPSYRGDIINSEEFTAEARVPDPENMMRAYYQAAATANLVRAFATGGYADLSRARHWNLDHHHPDLGKRYDAVVDKIDEGVAFLNTFSLAEAVRQRTSRVDFYFSHEALLLPYEEALTREDSITRQHYATSGHMLWIGDRTRDPDGAHVEFCRGVRNPIGIKCGPSLGEDDLVKLLRVLNPENVPGRITLIARFGADKVATGLPKLIRCVKREGAKVVWSCDPMHGNGIKSTLGKKTRPFDKIVSEVESFFRIHRAEGTYPGGIHLEMTGQDVTECIGGAQAITDVTLQDRYQTMCDPRLNASQALELAFRLAEWMDTHKAKDRPLAASA